MHAARPALRLGIALAVLAGAAHMVSDHAAAQNWLRDSLQWEARKRVLKSELVLEAEVLGAGLTTVITSDGCEWVSELWLEPREALWGTTADDSVRVFSGAVPAAFHRIGALMAFADSAGDPDCMLYQLDEQAAPLPEPGTVGIFQLQRVGAVEDALNLGPVNLAVQIPSDDGLVTVPGGPGRDDNVWKVDDFREALLAATASRRLEALIDADSLVAVVKLAPWKSRVRKRNAVTGSLVVRVPLQFERVFRGAVPDSCGLSLMLKSSVRASRVSPVAADRREREARRLALILQELPASRALVVGHIDSTDVFPIECLALDGDGRVRVIDPVYEQGELERYRYHELSEVEALLSPEPE